MPCSAFIVFDNHKAMNTLTGSIASQAQSELGIMVGLLCFPRFCFLCRCSRFRDVPWSTQLLDRAIKRLGVGVRLFSLPCTDGCVGPFRVPLHKAPGQQHTIWLLLLFLALVAFFVGMRSTRLPPL